ncbi:MAG: hypothetical protein E7A85_02775, partial [Anaerococcus sp.]|nr:hypothetical protein [Anaerococcus sp.]
MKFSINTNKYKENLIELREDLNYTLQKGYIDEEFKEKLSKLEKDENKILNELLPYYRLYAPELYETNINEIPVKIEGSYKLNTYLKSYLCIENNLFILSGVDQKTYFMRILEEDKQKIELSQPIKNFNKLIVYIYSLSKEKILLFTVTGDIFVLISRDFSDVFENINNLKIIELKANFKGFENIINIGENKFLCQTGRNEFLVLEFNIEDLSYKIKADIALKDTSQEINSLVKISNSYFALGSHSGDLILARYKNNKIRVDKKIKMLNKPIRYLTILENENNEKNICAILGDNKSFSLYDLERKKIVSLKKQDFTGNLFDIKSKKGSAFILSDDFHTYLLEENMGIWSFNSKVTISDRLFTNIISIDSSNYLTIDIYGNFYVLKL